MSGVHEHTGNIHSVSGACDACFCFFFTLTRLHTISLYMSNDSNNILFCSISILFPIAVYSSIQLDRSDIFLRTIKDVKKKKKVLCLKIMLKKKHCDRRGSKDDKTALSIYISVAAANYRHENKKTGFEM